MEFNNEPIAEHATIVLKDGITVQAEQIVLSADSAFFTDPLDYSRMSLSTHEIHGFENRNHVLGGLQGATFGGLGGILLGGGAFYLSARIQHESENETTYGIIYGGLIGSIAGLLYGAIHGSTDIYELHR